MTAPVHRSSQDSLLSDLKDRVRKLEGNKVGASKKIDWAARNVPCAPGAFSSCDAIKATTTNPQGYNLTSIGYVQEAAGGFCWVQGWIHMFRQGGFNAGNGSYAIPLSLTYPPVAEVIPFSSILGPSLGTGYAYDISATAYTQLDFRISTTLYLGGPCLEAVTPAGAIWGSNVPYTWAGSDILAGGAFAYPAFKVEA